MLTRRKKTFPWLKDKENGMQLVSRMSRIFDESALLDEALTKWCGWMVEHLQADSASIYLHDAAQQRFALRCAAGQREMFLRHAVLTEDDLRQCGLLTGEFGMAALPALTALPAAAHPFVRCCAEQSVQTHASLPLMAHARAYGLLLLASRFQHHISDDDREFFAIASQHVKLITEKRVLIEQFEQEVAAKISQIQESEEKYRVLFEDASDAIVSVDLETQRVLECNRQAQLLLGYAKDELLTMIASDFWQQKDEKRLVNQSLQLVKGQRSARFQERQLLRKDGASIWVEINTSIVEYRGKKVALAIVRDVTRRKQGELEKGVIDAVNAILLSGQPMQDMYQHLSRTLLKMMRFDRLDVLLPGKRLDSARILVSVYEEKTLFNLMDREFPLQHLPIEQIFCNGQPAIVNYAPKESPAFLAGKPGKPLASSLFFPLMFKETVIGVLHFGRQQHDHFSADFYDFFHRIAPQIAITLDNMLLFHTVNEEKAVYKHLIENVHEIVFQADPKGTILFVNHRVYDILGYLPEEITGTSFFACVIPEDMEEAKAAFRLTLRHEQPLSGEFRVFHKNGSMVTISIYTRPIFEEGRTVGMQAIIQDITPPTERIEKRREGLHEIIGHSQKMQEIYDLIVSVAKTDSTILIHGESGTGKELIAHAIHAYSHRQHHPFIVVNCAAYSEHLLESELFGHERGAFTGAHRRKLGRFELAKGGTIFLDEIGEISPHSQLLLLRVLQNKTFERVGGEKTLDADARIVAATNKHLETEMKAGRFREDLFYRLNVILIDVPPLRQRKEDIPHLIEHFRRKYSKSTGKQVLKCAQSTLEILMRYDWFGNVRELENTIERAVVMASGTTLLPEDLPAKLRQGEIIISETPSKTVVNASLHDHERDLILKALQATKWNKYQAAKLLDITRSTLYSKIKKYGIEQE